MNWGRGLFRLWAVATVFWVAGAAWLQWQDLRCDWEPSKYGCNPFDQFDTPQAELPKGFVPDHKPDPWGVVSQTPIDLSKLSDVQLTAFKAAGGDFRKLSDDMRKSILASLGVDVDRRTNGDWRNDPVVSAAPPNYDKLMDDAGFVVGPPILLLLVGGLLFWAIRGFRHG